MTMLLGETGTASTSNVEQRQSWLSRRSPVILGLALPASCILLRWERERKNTQECGTERDLG